MVEECNPAPRPTEPHHESAKVPDHFLLVLFASDLVNFCYLIILTFLDFYGCFHLFGYGFDKNVLLRLVALALTSAIILRNGSFPTKDFAHPSTPLTQPWGHLTRDCRSRQGRRALREPHCSRILAAGRGRKP